MTKNNFKLEQMFGSKTRARLMSLFLQCSQDAFYVRQLTRKIDAQLNSVRRELKNLLEMGLIREKHVKNIKELCQTYCNMITKMLNNYVKIIAK